MTSNVKAVASKDRPIVIIITEPIVAEYQTRHTIECSVEAFPNISSVEWNITTEAGTKIFSSDENNLGKYFGSSVTSPSLDILMADFTDTGRYICTAENIFGKTSSTVVYIQVYGISLTVSSTYFTVVYGNDVELKCNITGRPDITKVTWNPTLTTTTAQTPGTTSTSTTSTIIQNPETTSPATTSTSTQNIGTTSPSTTSTTTQNPGTTSASTTST
ncbi:HMCN [Mytilus coruscus]|uniref:HMCN n=1 Tax=Mytilus coruscus TaxID=42192 RepID=A0A6J8CYD5_MYTCO|nr:HMCN [Mytilus coruscus]